MCIDIGTYEPDCFSFHQSFEDACGVGGGEMQVLDSFFKMRRREEDTWRQSELLSKLSVCSYLGGWLC